MRMGMPLIKRCEECAGLFEEQTIKSGNTMGARSWTDGKMNAPMMPDIPWLVKCPHCRALLWLDEQPEARNLKWLKKKVRAGYIKPYLKLGIADYFKALEHRGLEANKERYLRMRAWWAGNDKRRDTEIMSTLSSREKANLKALEGFMDLSDLSDRLMAAEIKRELGQFDQALDLLMDVLGEDLAHVVIRIAELAREKDPYVRELESESVAG